MQTLSKLFAEIGFKVNTEGLKEFQSQMKALSAGIKAQIQDSKAQAAASKAVEAAHKADTAEIKKSIAAQNARKAAIQADTAELRKLSTEQRLETQVQREADRQRQISTANLRSFIVKVAAVSYAISRLTAQTRQHALAYRDFAFQTGMPLKNLQQFEAAAAQVAPNLTGERIASELTNLQQNLTNIEFGQGNIFPYQLLGISATTKDATQIVNGLRNAIQGLSNARAINLIERMGLSRDWLYILRMSREEFSKITAVMLSPQQIQRTTQMALAFNKLKFSLANFRDQLVALNATSLNDLFNSVTNIADALSRWFKEEPNAKRFFDSIVIGLSAIWLRAHPIIAALTAIATLFEDWWVAKQGGESLFGWGFDQAQSDTKVKPTSSTLSPWERVKQKWKEFKFLDLNPKIGEPGTTRAEKLMDMNISRAIIQTPMPGRTINNNIVMNGYGVDQGGELIGSLNERQSMISDRNLTSSQMTTIGSV